LRLLKKTLQDNLSLSSKLFLRGLYAAAAKTLGQFARLPRRVIGREPNGTTGRAGIVSPTQPAIDFASLEIDPALKKAAGARLPANIQTSIVIPVFNKAEFTFQCLRSLLEEIDFNETEVIVVDNASSDETPRLLSHFREVVSVIRNEENLGFGDACNQGAATARGKYLVFLNNDTEVLPGWLRQLVKAIEADRAVGAVGSMLLYPEGRIQEAGGIVWSDGEAHHYGWGRSPDDRRFTFAREVDYCSAASLLIRAELFQQLGGFDRRYAPAYYEDVDLCFGVRSLGFKVVYQPMSQLVHSEGATAGTDTSQGLKRFQITNREKFVEKWRNTLEREHLRKGLARLEDAANRNRNWPRIVVFDERIPSPDRDAGSLRMFLILKTLACWAHVIFVPFNRPQSIDYERALWEAGIETTDAVDYRKLLKHERIQTAIVSRPTMGEVWMRRIRRVSPKARIIFDMVDTHFLRLQREHEISGDTATLASAQRYRKLETKLAREADLVWCASAEDKQVMKGEVPDRRIEVVPTIHELRDAGKPFEEREGLLFIGNLAHRPNADAVLFFLREVYPLLHERLPEVRLDIIGDFGSDAIAAYHSDQVRILGYVPDVEPFLRDRRVFVAPLRFGAGIKGKVGEAMAHGVPVVTTSIGAEGFGLTHELNVMIANDPSAFAAAIVRLYSEQELWERVARNSRLRIENHFTPGVIAETINHSIQDSCKRNANC
jgi:GT2 family glycosyltransferase